jgi:arylsulfatase A-like enzyme
VVLRQGYFVGALCIALFLTVFVMSCSESTKIERPNIILIVSDALRPDHLGCYGYPRPTSPTIDSLARKGVLFETAVTQAPWTKASFSSMFTSLYVFQHGVLHWGSPMSDTLDTLAEVLARNGYETACVMNMIGLAGRFRVLQGFERVSAAGKLERDAGISTVDAIELMKESGEPFFLVLHYFDTHRPYTPGSEYYEAVHGEVVEDSLAGASRGIARLPDPPPELLEFDMALFDGAIRYVDYCTGRVLSYLEESGTKDRTFVIFTADHGDALWEHGVGDHGKTVYDEEILVPLIIAGPEGYWEPKRIPEQVGLIDLYPTILELTGIRDGPELEGVSLMSLIEGGGPERPGDRFLPPGYTASECTAMRLPEVRCIRRRDWKMIVEPSTARVELYNLIEDPGETRDLFGQGLAVEDTLLHLLSRIPGMSLGGWRIAFLGGRDSTIYKVEVKVAEGASIEDIDKLTQGRGIDVRRSREGWSMEVEAAPREIDMVVFNVSPDDGPLTFRVTAQGGDTREEVRVGLRGTRVAGTEFTMTRGDALGAPERLAECRRDRVPGVHIWWLPGEQAGPRTGEQNLTGEERKRLKALGYIQ